MPLLQGTWRVRGGSDGSHGAAEAGVVESGPALGCGHAARRSGLPASKPGTRRLGARGVLLCFVLFLFMHMYIGRRSNNVSTHPACLAPCFVRAHVLKAQLSCQGISPGENKHVPTLVHRNIHRGPSAIRLRRWFAVPSNGAHLGRWSLRLPVAPVTTRDRVPNQRLRALRFMSPP